MEGITQACAATLQLVKDLQPTSDTGRFNLSITYNGSTVGSASNVGNNGATAAVITVPGGSYALAEAAAAGTTLARYASSWQCTDQNNTVVSSGSGGSFTLQAPAMTATAVTLVCRITNRTRQAELSITKSDGSGTYTPGGTATYTLLCATTGPTRSPMPWWPTTCPTASPCGAPGPAVPPAAARARRPVAVRWAATRSAWA